jgi:glycosyltransferase involved in cell wall biosynthesis
MCISSAIQKSSITVSESQSKWKNFVYRPKSKKKDLLIKVSDEYFDIVREMKVCLRRGYHHVFDELINYPPPGVQYIIPKFVSPSGQFGFFNIFRRRIWRLYARVLNQPNAVYIPSGDAQLIHSGSGFLPKNQMPFVVDVEHVASFVGFEVGMLERVKHKVEHILSSDFCKKIMPWTAAAKESILNGLDAKKFLEKIEIVYPAMHPIQVKKKKHDKISLLFVSIRFFTKGGKELLQAYEVLKKSYDVDLTIVSQVPSSLKQKYPDVKFFEPNIPRQKILNDFFATADIFVLPSYMDTFGMVFLEAMSVGLPIVSTNVFAIPEIVNGAGFVIDVDKYSWYGKKYLFAWDSWEKFEHYVTVREKPEIVSALVKKISQLIDDSSLRKKMGKEGRRQILRGKFSIKNRNKKLKQIYEEALKKIRIEKL